MKLYFPVIFFVLLFSCTAEKKSLKEFIYDEFVMDGDSTRELLEPLKHVKEITPKEKREKWLDRMAAVAKKRFLTVKKDKIILVNKSFIEHYDWKIIKETPEKISIEVKHVLSVDKDSKKKYKENKKAEKLYFYFYKKNKNLLALTDEHFTWYRIWKKK